MLLLRVGGGRGHEGGGEDGRISEWPEWRERQFVGVEGGGRWRN